jgi:hypothetical protein
MGGLRRDDGMARRRAGVGGQGRVEEEDGRRSSRVEEEDGQRDHTEEEDGRWGHVWRKTTEVLT